jgi:hypothetical protein
MPEVEHDSWQRALCVVGPDATGKYERRAGFPRDAELAADRRALPVEWSIRLWRGFLQLSLRRDLLLCLSHLNHDAVYSVAIYFLSRLCVGTENEA